MSKASSVILNVENFIKDVESRPAIWNRNYHCNKPFLEQMWVELSTMHQLPIVVLKAKWKGLRDNFRVEYKRIPRSDSGEFLISPEQHESKWLHYYALLFLTEHMRHRQPKSEQESATYYFGPSNDDQDQDSYEQTLVEPDLSNGLIRIPDSDEEFDEDDDEDENTTSAASRANTSPEPQIITVKKETAEHMPLQVKSTVQLTMESLNKMNNVNGEPSNNKRSSAFSAGSQSSGGSVDGGIGTANSSNGNNSRSYSNGFIPSIKLKRPRLSEDDSNFNGSSTMDPLPEDDDYHYLLSLHPYMKQLTSAQKLRIRTKFQKLIFKELYKEDLEEMK